MMIKWIRNNKNLSWVLLFAVVSNAAWNVYTYDMTFYFHGKEVWYRNLYFISVVIAIIGGVALFYKVFQLVEIALRRTLRRILKLRK